MRILFDKIIKLKAVLLVPIQRPFILRKSTRTSVIIRALFEWCMKNMMGLKQSNSKRVQDRNIGDHWNVSHPTLLRHKLLLYSLKAIHLKRNKARLNLQCIPFTILSQQNAKDPISIQQKWKGTRLPLPVFTSSMFFQFHYSVLGMYLISVPLIGPINF